MKPSFDPLEFARTLLAESLYFDDEHGSIGSVSLVDRTSGREVYMASYDPETESWLLEEAVDWDEEPVESLIMATDGKLVDSFEDPLEIAGAILDIAEERDLSPVFLPLFEEPL